MSSTRKHWLRRVRPRFALSTMLLFVTAFAIGLANYQVGQKVEKLRSQISSLKPLDRSLEIEDPKQCAAVARLPEWLGESIFDVYIPAGQEYELCLALEEIDREGLAAPTRSVPLSSGEHSIEIRYDKQSELSKVSVLVDAVAVLEESKPKDWEPRRGSQGGTRLSKSRQFDTSKPLVLYRKRFHFPSGPRSPSTPKEPSPGILVWIQSKTAELDATDVGE